jgi:small subunit ribosomal protein S1
VASCRRRSSHPPRPDLDEFLGQELRCKVIELNARATIVPPRRAVLERAEGAAPADPDRLQPGNVVEGQISNIVDFGASSTSTAWTA